MTKIDELNSFLYERLTLAVNEILDTVKKTMQDYEEETVRIRKENDYLKEMLKASGCSFTETTSGDGSIVSSRKCDYVINVEQESEPQEAVSHAQALKKDTTGVKREPPSPRYHTELNSVQTQETQTNPKNSDQITEPLQGTSLFPDPADQEITDYDFTAKVKLESINTEAQYEAMDSIDMSNQSWSPQNLDLILDKSYPNRAQRGGSLQSLGNEGLNFAEYSFPNQSVEFQTAISYANRTICNNRMHCSSRYCELQKRPTSKSSPVWQYFSLKEGDCSKAVCLMCRAVISRGVKEYTTSALLKHLRMKHGKC